VCVHPFLFSPFPFPSPSLSAVCPHYCKDTLHSTYETTQIRPFDTIANSYLKTPFTDTFLSSPSPTLYASCTPCLQRSSTTTQPPLFSSFSTPLPHNPASNAVPPFLLPTPHRSLKTHRPTPGPLVRTASKTSPFHVAHSVLGSSKGLATPLLEGHVLYIRINQDFSVCSLISLSCTRLPALHSTITSFVLAFLSSLLREPVSSFPLQLISVVAYLSLKPTHLVSSRTGNRTLAGGNRGPSFPLSVSCVLTLDCPTTN